jgi:hypothetical protein
VIGIPAPGGPGAKLWREEGGKWHGFKNAMKAAISVPHSVIQQRIEEHRRRAAKNPNKRRPKPKA